MTLNQINMEKRKCAMKCSCGNHISRRNFIKNTSIAGLGTIFFINNDSPLASIKEVKINPIRACGPASGYIPKLSAAFVRRKEEYGMLWPGAVFDGEAALNLYSEQLKESAKNLNIDLNLKPVPIYSPEEADLWLAEAKAKKSDGLVVVLLDRQQHAWPTAKKAADTGIPTIVFSPLGTSFTTNTIGLAEQPGCVIYSTNDFSQAAFGMKMLKAGSRMRLTKCLVLAGNKRYEATLDDIGITLQYIPVETFLTEYNAMPVSKEIETMADDYIRHARKIRLATRQDVLNGIKSYKVAGKLIEQEKADAITMDCLGALGNTTVSLPCIAWSRMNDDGIPAACEADLGAVATHTIVQYLFDRPGFQQDPVCDTSDDTIIGAHCNCPTRLNGFNNPSEPFDIVHHHGNRDAVPRTIWKKGQRITCLDVLPGRQQFQNQESSTAKTQSTLLISTGTVVDNLSVPPSGGCVVSVKYKMDGDQRVLTYPGMHQLFFYGDYKRELKDFCQLYKFKAQVV